MKIANCKLSEKIKHATFDLQFSFCNLQFAMLFGAHH